MAEKILLYVYGATFSLSVPVIGHLGCDQCCRKRKYLCSMLTWSPLANSEESYGHTLCRSVFSILRNYRSIFHHCWHSHQQCLSFLPPNPAPAPVFLIFISLKTSIVDGVTWNLNIILIHISLMSNEVEQFLQAYWKFADSFENILFLSFHWVAWIFLFSVLVLCIFSTLVLCHVHSWQRFFSHSLVTWLAVSFAMHKIFHFIKTHLSILALISWAIIILFTKFLCMAFSQSLLLIFSLNSLRGLVLELRPLFPLE